MGFKRSRISYNYGLFWSSFTYNYWLNCIPVYAYLQCIYCWRKLILKKSSLVTAKSYSIHKIGSIHSVYISCDKYTTVQMKNEDKSLEKYIILSNESLFSKTIDPEEILTLLRDTAMYEKE